MGFGQGGASRHSDVQLYSDSISNAACTQVMRVCDVGHGLDDVCYLLFCARWQGTVGEVFDASSHEFHSGLDEHGSDDDGCQGIEHRPSVSEEESTGYSDGGSYGGECI